MPLIYKHVLQNRQEYSQWQAAVRCAAQACKDRCKFQLILFTALTAKSEGGHLLDEPLAALMSSSARHSAMVLMFLKEASRAPVLIR